MAIYIYIYISYDHFDTTLSTISLDLFTCCGQKGVNCNMASETMNTASTMRDAVFSNEMMLATNTSKMGLLPKQKLTSN